MLIFLSSLSLLFQHHRRGRRRVTRMIVAVVLGNWGKSKCSRDSKLIIYLSCTAFAICWLPIQIILVLKSINLYHQTSVLVGIQIFSHILAYLSSCVNPLLYAFLSENFRKAFNKVSQRVLVFTVKIQLFPAVSSHRLSVAARSTIYNRR